MSSDSEDIPLICIKWKGSLRTLRVKGDDAMYDSSGSLSDVSPGCYSDKDPNYVPAQCYQHSPALPDEEQHHTSSTSPLKYMQVSIDPMRVIVQETELRPNTKTQETAKIENDSSRVQEAASTPDTQNQSMHNYPPIVFFTFIRRVLSGRLYVRK